MTRTPTTIEEEMERLRAGAPARDYLARKAELFEGQVSQLAGRLEPDVKVWLEREASPELAKEWVDEATHALNAIAPELRELEQRQEFRDALARVQSELSGQVLRDVIRPTDDEIHGHARELAQCVLANWLSSLEHAKQDNPGKALSLSANGLPRGVGHTAVLEGVEDFVVPVKTVALAFNAYRDALKQSGPIVELAPSLYVAQKSGDAYLVDSEEAARQLVAQEPRKAPEKRKPLLTLRGAPQMSPLRLVLNRLDPYLNTLPGILSRSPKPAVAATHAYEDIEKYATAAVLRALGDSGVLEALRDPNESVGSGALLGKRPPLKALLDEPQRRITIDLANYLLLDYRQAFSTLEFVSRWEQHGVEKRLAEEAENLVSFEVLDCAYRVSAQATASAFVGLEQGSEDLTVDSDDMEGFFGAHPEAKVVVDLAVQATKEALAMPQAKGIAEQVKRFAFDMRFESDDL